MPSGRMDGNILGSNLDVLAPSLVVASKREMDGCATLVKGRMNELVNEWYMSFA